MLGPAIQTSRNTVDLRGMYVEDALMHLEFSLQKNRQASALFVIHGEGTGALRAGVLKKLKGHPLVSKFEQESPMNYGCTVVYMKRQ
jgi:DNA mismatch repair protein MutS2